MAWRCSGRSNQELISNLSSEGLIKSPLVAKAMSLVDRANYCADPTTAYQDSPQSINYGATISAPHMHAHAVENLLPLLEKPGARVLDVGSGSGYTMAVFWHIVRPHKGTVVGIDHIKQLVDWSVHNLKKDQLAAPLDQGEIRAIHGDGRKGWKDLAPYDAIHVGAAAPTMPQELIDQLNKPGRMFIPVDSETGYGQ